MKFEIRHYTKFDQEMVNSWWKHHKSDLLPEDLLSSNGRVVELEGVPICAGWLYQTDSSFSVLEWITANPEVKDREVRDGALDFLLTDMKSLARELGCRVIFSSLRLPCLIKRYLDHGFIVGDENMTNLIYNVPGGLPDAQATHN